MGLFHFSVLDEPLLDYLSSLVAADRGRAVVVVHPGSPFQDESLFEGVEAGVTDELKKFMANRLGPKLDALPGFMDMFDSPMVKQILLPFLIEQKGVVKQENARFRAALRKFLHSSDCPSVVLLFDHPDHQHTVLPLIPEQRQVVAVPSSHNEVEKEGLSKLVALVERISVRKVQLVGAYYNLERPENGCVNKVQNGLNIFFNGKIAVSVIESATIK